MKKDTIEQLAKGIKTLRQKVVKVKNEDQDEEKNKNKFTKKKDWKRFRANINKGR